MLKVDEAMSKTVFSGSVRFRKLHCYPVSQSLSRSAVNGILRIEAARA